MSFRMNAAEGYSGPEAVQAGDAVMSGGIGIALQTAPTASGGLIQRALPGAATRTQQRELVEDTIRFLQMSADYWRLATIDKATFDRVVTSWYAMAVQQEKIIGSALSGDAALKQRLRAAYSAAIQVMVAAAAKTLRIPMAELYRRNRGRIPVWAWPTAHHMEAGISTPIEDGHSANPRTGAVTFTANNIQITIARDRFNRAVGNNRSARTRLNLNPGIIRWRFGRAHTVTSIMRPRAPTAYIQTDYAPRVSPTYISGYGRGTTVEDIAGAAIDPRSGTLGFHEGNHGLDYVAWIKNHRPPTFAGSVGMNKTQIQQAADAWQAAWRSYDDNMQRYSHLNTDCVGTPKDSCASP